ncbi:MAG: prolyl oligopeptidase family serine peptidase [Halomonas sp.]|uniref:prolyl oligopeptidase family serine peptidase n=1 Tax=Halomonas sp. TaxID=1486246 RepID=UPI001A017E26|nr:PHB depolymerase family esterase [Halomonas sp.]MBE0488721.1 prolyl oligopeptidase family serine peptidase [Halomonas sp.]
MTSPTLLAAGLVLAAFVALPAAADRLPDLPRLGLAKTDASVIGVSSGGYMATQLAVAWPERFQGLAVLGAGPWSCAQGTLRRALGQCMTSRLGPPSLDELEQRLADYRELERVGSAEALAELRAFVWHGEKDEIVAPALGAALAEQLAGWLAAPETQLRFVQSDGVGHGWPIGRRSPPPPATELGDCHQGGGTHLLGCDRDLAGEAMAWLHKAPPGADEAAEADSLTGDLLHFDQGDFAVKGLDSAGYLFVPEACDMGGCALTVALHGCGMSAEQIGETFVRHSGLNEWAAAHERVVLYPQAETSLANPQGCWDWWGFAESTWQLDPLHDTREGTQVRALMAMMDRLQEASTPR